jgi:DNA-directed RNA polymerase specialized sigma24 family protein
MSWLALPPEYREVAERVCTPAQVELLKVISAGYGLRPAARILDIDPSTARDRLARATRRIREEMGRQAQAPAPVPERSSDDTEVSALEEEMLTDEQLRVVRLRARGLSWTRIAAMLGLPVSTVRGRAQRAEEAMRRARKVRS